MALNHTLPHTPAPVELEPVEYTGHTVPSTVRVCPNMGYTIPLINHRFPTTEHTYFKAYTKFSGVRCTIYCCLCIHISYTDIYSICPRKQHPTIGLVPFFLMKSPINTQDVNQTQHFWWRMPIDFWWYWCFYFTRLQHITAMMQFQARTELATTWSRVVVLRTTTKPSMGIHGNGENMSLNQLVFCLEQSQSNKLGSYPLVV